MTLTLNPAELSQLTGLKQAKRMNAWLQDRGWTFEPGRRRGEYPSVDRANYLARMSGQVDKRRSRLKLDRM